MEYHVYINKKFRNIKSYRIMKSSKGNTNAASRLLQSIIDKYVLKKQQL